jgi:hypothetical protein
VRGPSSAYPAGLAEDRRGDAPAEALAEPMGAGPADASARAGFEADGPAHPSAA